MSLDAMKLALEALEFLALENFVELDKSLNVGPTHGRKAILALRAAIEKAERPRQWQGLTADEIWQCNAAPKGSEVEYHICMTHQNVLDFAEAIEAKLKEKNT